MKTLTLPLHQLQSPQEVLALLAEENLRKGDKLDIVISEDEKNLLVVALLLLLAVALLSHFGKQLQEKRIADGGRILDDLFAKGNSEEIEKELEAEYGIEIEFIRAGEETDDDAVWSNAAAQLMNNSYGDDEPDYSDLLQESNPHYKPNPNYKG